MINLRNSPFLWLAIVLLCTYGFDDATGICLSPALKAFLGGCLGMATLLAFWSYGPQRYYWSTVGISGVIIFSGLLHKKAFEQTHFPTPLLDSAIQVNAVVEVVAILKVKPNRLTLRVRHHTLAPAQDSVVLDCHDRYWLLQLRDPDSLQLLPGDVLQLRGWLSAISPSMNPHSFDMRKYYTTLVVRHQLSCKATDVQIKTQRNTIQRLTARWQRNLSAIVKANTSPSSAQVINALVWGDRSDMAEDVRDAFADSGAMHVLSVSGMHVAMIYSLLMLLLGAPGEGTFAKRLVRFMLYAVCILLYVGLTGACPAVVRAGLMILLYLFGKSMGWNTQVWNLIGFAAFMMMWINPMLYQNVGFQLSFLAMTGILLYAKPIIRSLAFKYKLAHWTWEVVALSLAAQIFILPVILGQFHQFPLTFIASSIVAIPAGYVVIFGAILNVILSVVHIDFLWPLLDRSCIWFVDSMKWMAGLNPSMHYSLPSHAAWLLALIALLYSFSLEYRWPWGKHIAYGCCVLFGLCFIQHRMIHWQRKEIIVYHHFSGIAVDVFLDGYVYAVHSPALTPAQIEFPTRGYRCYQDIIAAKHVSLGSEFSQSKVALHENRLHAGAVSMLFYSQKQRLGEINNVSHVVISDCRDTTLLLNFLNEIPNAQIIIPASCPRRDATHAINALQQQQRIFHDINTEGYFRISL